VSRHAPGGRDGHEYGRDIAAEGDGASACADGWGVETLGLGRQGEDRTAMCVS